MIEQVNNAVKFLAFFVASKVGKTGLADVTVDVYDPAGSLVANGAAASEIGGGLYSYELAANQVSAVGEYPAVFKTADATVDAQHVPSLWVVGRAGVENLDAAVSTVWDEDTSNHLVANSFGEWVGQLLTLGASAAVWNYDPATFIANSAGTLLENAATAATLESNLTTMIQDMEANLAATLTAATVTVSTPISADGGTITLVRGDDYSAALGREISFSSTSWPDLTNSYVEMTIRRRREAFGTGSDPVLVNTEDVANSRIVGSGSQTVVFELLTADTTSLLPGSSTGKFDVQAILEDNSVVTLCTGVVTVTEDQTRTTTVPA